jgi:hypothetical protein
VCRSESAITRASCALGLPRLVPYRASIDCLPEAVLDILNRELVAIMRQAGTPTVADITGASVVRPAA